MEDELNMQREQLQDDSGVEKEPLPSKWSTNGRSKGTNKKGKPIIKKGHMEFRQRDGRIDIEELINEDMDDDDGDDDGGFDYNGLLDLGLSKLFGSGNTNKDSEDGKKTNGKQQLKIRTKLKKSRKTAVFRRKNCTCRTMNIYDPLYVLFNMCPVIPKGCP